MPCLLRGTVGLRSLSKLTSNEFFPLHNLAAKSVARRMYGGSALRGGGYQRRASPEFVVGGTIAVCVGIWIYAISAQNEANEPSEYLQQRPDGKKLEFLRQNFVVSRRNVDEGRWWTLITSTFTHFSAPHLAINMLTLWNLGRPLVLFYGAPTYVLLWLAAGAGGSAIQIYWSDIMSQAVKRKIIKKPFWVQEDIGGIGASGSISGMFGVMAFAFRGNTLFTLSFVTGSILCLENDWLPNIGHKSHLGGMAVGATWWLLFLRRRRGW